MFALLTGEAEHDDAPTRRRYVVNDLTYEKLGEILAENPHGVLSVRDEMRGLFLNLAREESAPARAFYLQQKWIEALRAFNEVARLDPSWVEDSVTPYVRAIEAKIKPREMPVASDAPEQQRTLH